MLGRKQQRPQAGAGGCTIRQLPALISLAFAALQAHAGEPTQPTRTVYRCEEGNKVSYSDAPCLGAKKVDVTPTRGLNKSTGQELTGPDVRREHTREQIGAAARPITGMSTQQFDQAGRRTKLSTQAQQSCRKLDHALPLAEQAERAARSPVELKSAQEQLFDLRKQFREQRCD